MTDRLRLALLAVLLGSSLVLAQKGGVTPAHVMATSRVASVHPSPDGRSLAFVRLEPRKATDAPGGAWARLYIMPLAGRGAGTERLLIGGQKSTRGVAFVPDGSGITFLDRRDGAPHDEIYVLPLEGGEPYRMTETPHGVSSYAWSPDGSMIAYTVADPAPAARAESRARGFRPVVVDEDFDQVSLWSWTAKTGKSKQLTEGVSVFSMQWSPDGKLLAAGVAPRNLVDDRYMDTTLRVVNPKTGKLEVLVDNPGKLGAYAWAPDGESLAYVSAVDRRDPHAGMLYTVAPGGTPKLVTEGFKGMVEEVSWRGPGTVLAQISLGVRTHVATLDVTTGERRLLAGGRGVAFHGIEPIPGREATLAAVGSSGSHPDEVYLIDMVSGAEHRMTRSNPWLDDVTLGRREIITFQARDGLTIEGLLYYPLGFEADKTYPLVIVAHGGPESHFNEGWNTSYSQWGQMLSARGFFAWYPNYRSSTGYGVEFVKKDHGDPMGAEFDDHLDAIEYLANKGLVDRKRVGVGGGSYGGYTAAWAATRHSEHFAAAVSFVPFVEIRTKWLTTDIPNEFYWVHYQEKWPHQQKSFLEERSPLTYAPLCRTPLLLAGGTADPRVHPSQPFMLYRAVKVATETPVRYVQYPGEGHGNRTNTNQLDYCLRALRWFEHYLAPGEHRQDPPPPLDLTYPTW